MAVFVVFDICCLVPAQTREGRHGTVETCEHLRKVCAQGRGIVLRSPLLEGVGLHGTVVWDGWGSRESERRYYG